MSSRLISRLTDLNSEIERKYVEIDKAQEEGNHRIADALINTTASRVLDYQALREELCLEETEPV